MNTLAFQLAIATGLAALSGSALAQEFPLTIEHRFGSTTIAQEPERIATVDTNGADNLLALGIQPVVIENWYGDYERTVWPWAEPLLEDDPVVLERGDLNFELIASAEPDLILSLWNDLTADDYEKLSLIAPVVAMPEGVGDFDLAWYDQALIAGRAIGREAEAQQQVESIRARLDEIATSHPQWQGKTIAVAVANDSGTVGAYTAADARPQLMSQLGFINNPPIEAAIGNAPYFVQFSLEERAPFEADLLMWIDGDGDFTAIKNLPNRAFLDAHREGREIVFGKEVTGAFSHASLLSLPYALDRVVPAIEAAMDGEPETRADDRPGAFVPEASAQ